MADKPKTTNYGLTKPTEKDFYDINDANGNMDIIDTELKKLEDGKAPSGHGLGTHAEGFKELTLKKFMGKGSGFYQAFDGAENPTGGGAWLGLLQLVRNPEENSENGSQLAISDFSKPYPQMWLRTLSSGTATNWVEMLHTGNISKYASVKMATGSYSGGGTNSKSLPNIPFLADMILIQHRKLPHNPMIIIRGMDRCACYGQAYCNVTWSDKTPTWSTEASNANSMYAMNESNETYYWVAFGGAVSV